MNTKSVKKKSEEETEIRKKREVKKKKSECCFKTCDVARGISRVYSSFDFNLTSVLRLR